MRSLYWIREAGYRVIFDATHPCSDRVERGRDFGGWWCFLAPVLGAGAMAAGCDGMFMEVHGRSGACFVGWAESDSAKGFAEALAHVKGYSCCCFVAATSQIGPVRWLFVDFVVDFDIGVSGLCQSKGHKKKESPVTAGPTTSPSEQA